MTHSPNNTIELPPGASRLARGLAALVTETERQPNGMRDARRSVVKALFPHEAERITAILEGTPTKCSERGMAKQAATILGLKPRKLQAMSQRGEIPGAAKLGRQWTYDLAKLRRFVEQQEKATTCQRSARPRPDATGAAKFSGARLRSADGGSGGRLRQMIQQSQRRAGKLAKRER